MLNTNYYADQLFFMSVIYKNLHSDQLVYVSSIHNVIICMGLCDGNVFMCQANTKHYTYVQKLLHTHDYKFRDTR